MPRRTEPDPLVAKIGTRIRTLREAKHLTQEKAAYESGLKSKGHLSGIEKGLIRPTLKTLTLLAERLEVDLLDLFTFPRAAGRGARTHAKPVRAGPCRRARGIAPHAQGVR